MPGKATRQIAAGIGALAIVALVVALALGGTHHAHAQTHTTSASIGGPHTASSAATAAPHAANPTAAHTPTTTGAHDPASGARGRSAGHRQDATAEAPDPEESKSFPVSGTVHHADAATPHTAAAEVVAPGAQSNSEVEAELKQMHAVQQAARKRETETFDTVPGGDSIGGDGQLPIPADVPEVVQRVIAGANAITDFPYVYGGGHASFVSNSYDCSGSVSYALAAGGLLSAPETSGQLESWGEAGPGKWITIYANAGHVYMYVNIGGRWMRFDTVGRSGPYASRWQPEERSNEGFVARHWPGL